MKRLFALLFAFMLTASMSAFAVQASSTMDKPDKKTAKAEKKEADAASKGKTMRLTGWVKDDGGKTVFVNDKDKASWNIENPDAVKGHEGHHVSIKAKLNESDHSVNVESLKMLRKGKQSGEMQKSGKS